MTSRVTCLFRTWQEAEEIGRTPDDDGIIVEGEAVSFDVQGGRRVGRQSADGREYSARAGRSHRHQETLHSRTHREGWSLTHY